MTKSEGNTADFLVERLYDWGVRRVYGCAGEDINEVLGALDRADTIRLVPSVQGELAAFMASGHAKLTGEVGVCLCDGGAGALHLLPGLYDARKDNVPVVAIVGQQPRLSLGSDFQQEIDLSSVFADVASDYLGFVSTPAQMRTMIDMALRVAISARTVTAVIVPIDVQAQAMETARRIHGAVYSGLGYSRPRLIPRTEDLRKAADLLNGAEKVAILVGAGALGVGDLVEDAAQKLNAGVAKALLGKDVLPDDLPYVTGGIGLLGTSATWEMMANCDALLMLGTNFPYAEFLPPEGQARAVQVDVKARHLGLRYPTEINLHGDCEETLLALLPMLEQKADRRWREKIESSTATWWKVLERRAAQSAEPVNPQRIFWELSSLLPEKAVLSCDSGSSVFWFARDLKVRKGMRVLHSGGLASMGPSIPYALASKLAFPDRPVFLASGDAAMQMHGLNALISVADTWKQWVDPRMVMLVLNNGDLAQISFEQRIMQGNPRFDTSQRVPPFDYAAYASQLGLTALRIERPEEIGPVLRQAFEADRPVLIDALVDPNVIPLPPHIHPEQALNFVKAVLKGDSQAFRLVVASVKETMASWTEQAKGLLA